MDITSIEIRNDIGDTPARINYKTGALYINADVWAQSTSEEKAAFIEHERGHVVLGTKVEQDADAFAVKEYKKRGLSSKAFVKTFTKHLDLNDPDHRARIAAVIKAIAKQDFHAGNYDLVNKLIHAINKQKMEFLNEYSDETAHITGFDGSGNIVDFKKAFQNRLDKQLAKATVKNQIDVMKDGVGRRGIAVRKHGAIDQKRLDTGQAKLMKGEAGLILANQGIQQKSATGEVFGEIGGAVSKIMGGGGSTSPATAPIIDENQEVVESLNPTTAAEPKYRSMAGAQGIVQGDNPTTDSGKDEGPKTAKNKSIIMYVGIGVGILALCVIGWLATRSK